MATNDREIIAWDSCVVIDALEKKEGGGAKGGGPYHWIKPLVDDAEAEKLVVLVSTLAIAETLFINGLSPEEGLRVIEEFYDYPWVRAEASGRVIATIARDLRCDHNLEGIDSIHVATALSVGAPVFLTQDRIRKKGKTPPLALDNKLHFPDGRGMLRIRTPESHQQKLHDAANPLFGLQTPLARAIDTGNKGGPK